MRLNAPVIAVAALAGVLACAPSGDKRASEDTHADAIPPCTPSANLVDKAMCPRLRAAGCAIMPLAPTSELCRRLFVDLTGAAPTLEETQSTCAGKDARAIASTLMETAAYARHSRELWGEILGYDATQINGRWLADADLLVTQLVTGAMPYDTFAKRILGHPLFGVGGRMPRSDLANDDDRYFPQVSRLATKVFLGRATIAGEDVALAKLFRFWKKRNVILNVDYGRSDPVLDPSACPCQTSAFGVATSITLPLAAPVPYEDVAVGMAPELRAELDKVGALFATQDSFWTQAVDLAMRMTLGWWKSTRNQDASMLPEVQAALADSLRSSPARSWRDLVLEIVTSELYVRSNRLGASAPDDLPPWCMGPLRVMRPEAYVSTVGKLLGVRVGRCDHRTSERIGRPHYPDGTEGSFFPEDLREDEASDAAVLGVGDYHYVAASSMGGCTAGAARSEDPTLTIVFGAAPVAQKLCAVSQSSAPAGAGTREMSEEAAAARAERLSLLLRGRVQTAGEREAITKDAARCRATATCDARALAVDMCASIARSIDAMTY